MKNHTYIYCGEDGNAGRALGNQIRDKDSDNKVRLLSCEFFSGPEPDAEHVIIMPDVPDHIGSVIRAAYPQNIVEARAKTLPPVAYEMPLTAFYTDVANELAATPFVTEAVTELPAKRKPGRPRKAAA